MKRVDPKGSCPTIKDRPKSKRAGGKSKPSRGTKLSILKGLKDSLQCFAGFSDVRLKAFKGSEMRKEAFTTDVKPQPCGVHPSVEWRVVETSMEDGLLARAAVTPLPEITNSNSINRPNERISKANEEEKSDKQPNSDENEANLLDDHDWNAFKEDSRMRRRYGGFPPPLASLSGQGSSHLPHVQLQRIRSNGRFVLQEVKTPPQSAFQPIRSQGRLVLQLIHQTGPILPVRDPNTDGPDPSPTGQMGSGAPSKPLNSNLKQEFSSKSEEAAGAVSDWQEETMPSKQKFAMFSASLFSVNDWDQRDSYPMNRSNRHYNDLDQHVLQPMNASHRHSSDLDQMGSQVINGSNRHSNDLGHMGSQPTKPSHRHSNDLDQMGSQLINASNRHSNYLGQKESQPMKPLHGHSNDLVQMGSQPMKLSHSHSNDLDQMVLHSNDLGQKDSQPMHPLHRHSNEIGQKNSQPMNPSNKHEARESIEHKDMRSTPLKTIDSKETLEACSGVNEGVLQGKLSMNDESCSSSGRFPHRENERKISRSIPVDSVLSSIEPDLKQEAAFSADSLDDHLPRKAAMQSDLNIGAKLYEQSVAVGTRSLLQFSLLTMIREVDSRCKGFERREEDYIAVWERYCVTSS